MQNHVSGKRLGILGGGQLGRMSAMAAARLGIEVVIFCPEEDSPASQVAKETIVADYTDRDALRRFAEKVDVVSYEFENIPIETIAYLSELKTPVYPEKTLLEVSQDRMREKAFLNGLNIETASWSEIHNLQDIQRNLDAWESRGAILKTSRFGYDGKGQIKVTHEDLTQKQRVEGFLSSHRDNSIIMENIVPFKYESSVIIARDIYGNSAFYGLMVNEHKNHILHKTILNSSVSKIITQSAFEIAQKVADAVDLVGILTIELFVCEDNRVLANEIAPRTHNSGHWSIDACAVSQFENHVRTVCGLPVGASARHSDAVMLNLIGSDIDGAHHYLTQKDTCLHLYGKPEAREGRKMGHVTTLTPINQNQTS